MSRVKVLCAIAFVLLGQAVYAQKQVVAVGLFEGAALLRVDGMQKLVRTGEVYEGVKVESATPMKVVVSQAGETEELRLTSHIATAFTPPSRTQWSIPANSARQYITTAAINGRRLKVLVDTGATVVALSSLQADRLQMNYRKEGREGTVTTASGVAKAWHWKLERVNVGGLDVGYIDATVIEGPYPEIALLGMSFLEKVDMRETSGVLHLYQKF